MRTKIRVHPRVRGETKREGTERFGEKGPSPRARGNLVECVASSDGEGSIPACAGKPSPGRERSGVRRVHPRVRGETVHPRVRGETANGNTLKEAGLGPSPRARGNRWLVS